MRKKLLSKLMLLLAFLLVGASNAWAQSDKSEEYTGNVVLSTEGGTNASTCKITINDVQYDGIKAGTSSKVGAVVVTVPSGTKYLHLHAIAWKATDVTLAITPESAGVSDIQLVADDGISGNSPFTLASTENASSDYYKVITFTTALSENIDLTFTATGGNRFVIFGVTAEKEGGDETPVMQTVATPTFNPAAGEVEAGKEIVISCATEGATIYYTLDESDPTAESTKYTAPITVNERTVIKAIAVKEGMTTSAVATAEYTIKEEVGPGDEGDTKTDVLNREFTGITGTTYTEWSGKTSNSDAVYAGQSAGSNESIQLRSNNNNSGVVTTTSGGKVKKIIVTWNSNTADGRTLNVYGSNTAYTAATDLYNEEKQGTLLGTIVNGTSTELVVTGDYEYVGLRSASGAMYLDKVEIVWAIPEGGETSTAVATTVTIDATGITNTNLFAGTAAGKLTAVVKTVSGEVIEGAVVSWESSDENVADVANDGTVTLVGAGTTVITATYAEVENKYMESSATYSLTVTNDDPNGPGTADNPYTVAQARAAIDAGKGLEGVYAKGIVSEIVTAFNSQYGNITYNISEDGTKEADQLQAYRGKGKDGANFTSEDDIKVGDEVVIYGNLKKYVKDEVATYEFDQNNQLVSLVRPETGLQASDFALTGDNTALTFDLYNKKDAQTLAFTTSSTGAITVDENAYVAVRVDVSNKTITVTPKATTPGEVAIKVEQAEDNTYEAGKVTFTVLITNSNPDVVGCTKDNPYTVAQAVEAINAGEGVNGVYVKGIISQLDSYNTTYKSITYWISADGTTTDQFEVYSGRGLDNTDFAALTDLKLGDEVVIYGNIKKYGDVYEFDKQNYIVSLVRAEKQDAGLAYETTSFTINVGESFTAPELTNPNNLTVTYTSSNESVATVDANTGVVTLGNGIGVTTIKATFEGSDSYFAGEASYTLEVVDPNVPGKTVENAYTVAQARAAIDAGEGVTGVYVKGIISQLDSYNSTYKSITYWISADGTTTDQFEVYSGRGLDDTDFAALTDLKLGDEVVIYGNIKKYGDVYEFDKQNYIVSLVRTEPIEVAAPTFSVVEGEVAAGTEVKIILPEGAEYIRYTVDGTDPSEETGNGDKYADPIVITNTTTIKAIAVDANGNVSKVVSVTYTVKGDEPVDENGWVKTTWAELTPNDVFVIVGTNADGAFAMSNDNGTAKAPVPVAVTLDGAKLVSGVTENIQWTVGSSDNGYIFYPAGTTDAWLYCTNTNNGVRVGTGDASVFTVSEEGYLYNVGNNRYIGIYNSQDWRCYTSINNNIKDQTFAVYKKVGSLVTITNAGWASWVAPYDAKISDGVSAYIVTEIASDKVMLTEVENIPEGTPVLLNGTEGLYGFGAAETLDNVVDNLLQAADGNVKGNGSIYALGKNNAGQIGFNKVAEDVVVPEGKAYLVVTATVRDFLAFTNGEADGINAVDNGQLIGNVVYDLSGRRVEKAVKGIYIVNGKKVVK